jgi:hypothetical protein
MNRADILTGAANTLRDYAESLRAAHWLPTRPGHGEWTGMPGTPASQIEAEHASLITMADGLDLIATETIAPRAAAKHQRGNILLDVLGAIAIIGVFIAGIAAALPPLVVADATTGECVRVIAAPPQYDCKNLPRRYEHVWGTASYAAADRQPTHQITRF